MNESCSKIYTLIWLARDTVEMLCCFMVSSNYVKRVLILQIVYLIFSVGKIINKSGDTAALRSEIMTIAAPAPVRVVWPKFLLIAAS